MHLKTDPHHKPIILTCFGKILAGGEIHTIYNYKALIDAGIQAKLLVIKNTPMDIFLKKQNLPHQTISDIGLGKIRLIFKIKAAIKLWLMSRNLGPCIMQCTCEREVWSAHKASLFHSIQIIFIHHFPKSFKSKKIRHITGALGAGKQTVEILNDLNATNKLNIRHIDILPMFFDQDKFLTYHTTETRSSFFSKNFNFDLPNTSPILCIIANLYPDPNHKNHPLLLQTIKLLNATRPTDKKVHALLVGEGSNKEYLQTLAQSLGITDNIHFLGFTDQTPALLYYSDIHVLPSKKEAFGLVYLEAGLMKKPSIGAVGSGAENIILHEKTGLLFENNNAKDLAAKIERLINDPLLCRQLGERAYQFVMKNHSNDVNLQKMLHFYKKLAHIPAP